MESRLARRARIVAETEAKETTFWTTWTRTVTVARACEWAKRIEQGEFLNKLGRTQGELVTRAELNQGWTAEQLMRACDHYNLPSYKLAQR